MSNEAQRDRAGVDRGCTAFLPPNSAMVRNLNRNTSHTDSMERLARRIRRGRRVLISTTPTCALVLACVLQVLGAEANRIVTRGQRSPGGSVWPPTTNHAVLPASANPFPDLILTGIAGFSSVQWAWLTVAEPGKPSRTLALRVGQKQGDLELRQIDFRSGTVRVHYRGVEAALSFPTHSTQNESVRLLQQSREYVERVRPFVEEHARAHALREELERERRDRERADFERTAAARATRSTAVE